MSKAISGNRMRIGKSVFASAANAPAAAVAAGALEAFELGPLGVKRFDKIGMEWIAGEEPFLGVLPFLAGLIVKIGDPF